MEKRKLGGQGLEASALGLGCMGMSWAYGPSDQRESISTIRQAIDLGVTLFDTAQTYGPFENERLLGRAVRGRRHEVTLATKFGFRLTVDGEVLEVDGLPEHVGPSVEESLRRLGIETIDLLYLHRLDRKVPIEETVGAMADLVREGKVRYLGLCEVGAQTLRRAHAVHPISALQSEYSLWERGVEAEILPAVRGLEIGFVCYCPLGRSFLTGDARRSEDYPDDDYRRIDPRMQGENFDRNLRLVDLLRGVAEPRGLTPAQVALAWLLAQGEDVVPIPGTRRRSHLEENLGAADVQLTPEEIARLDAAAAPGTTAGARYNDELMSLTER